MHAAFSPIRCTWGFSRMVCTGLFPLDRAEMKVKQCRGVGLLPHYDATFLARLRLFCHCWLGLQIKIVDLVQTILKVEAMKIMSFHQVAQGLGLKGGQARITNLPVRPKKTSAMAKRGFELWAGGLKLTHKSQSLRCWWTQSAAQSLW